MKTNRFIARYIRDASRNREKRTQIMDMLERDQPFDEETVGAVALIDISGFTALTSTLLAQQGRRSSEEMTQAVSKFMSKIIDIISYYGGDVIKFLGDALLVVFEARGTSEDDLRVLIKGKAKSVTSPGGVNKKGVEEDLLDLHIGISAGAFHHVIVGVAGQRCDYFVHGPPLGEIGGALDNARPGELGIAKSAVQVLQLPESIYTQLKIRKYETKGGSQTCEFKSLEAMQNLVGKLEPARLDFLSDGKRRDTGGANSVTSETLAVEVKLADAFCFQFMNQSLVHKVKNLQNSNRGSGCGGGRVGAGGLGLATSPGVVTSPGGVSECATSGMDVSRNAISPLGVPASPGMSRASSFALMDEEEESGSKDGPSSEYRKVTIMFIKFRFSYTKMRAHQLFSVLIKGLAPYDGVTQQFSVDDKGQSFFAVFGLPPWSHENNASFAVRAAITVSDQLKSQGLTPFTIGLSTGDLLFSHMGSVIRSEAGLLGDVVNVAARLMIFNKAEGYNIFCDYDTHEATSELYHHAEIGLHMLKGKLEPVSIWAIKNSKLGVDNLKINVKDKRNFGYAEEKGKVNSVFTKWMADKQQAILIVEGPSGMGKTSLLETALATMVKTGAKISVIRGSEIEKMNSLYPIKNLMRSVYSMFGKLNESDKSAMLQKYAIQLPVTPHSQNVPQIVIEIDASANANLTTSERNLSAASPVMGKKSATKKKGPSKQHTNPLQIEVDESLEGTKEFLRACGLDPNMFPIMASVMDWIVDKGSEEIQQMDAGVKKEMLQDMIVGIMKAMTETVQIAVLCDDLQFMDNTTLEILCAIIKSTSKTLYFLFSRPFTIYKLTAVQSLITLPSAEHIFLNGLSLVDTQKMLVWKFRDLGAMTMDKELLRVIHLRSSGSPFFLDKLADTLLASLPRVIGCDDKGVISTTVSNIDYQEILAINVESAILVSFDQLDHHFQELLRVASEFGMFFDLYDVSAVIDGNYPPDDLITMAETLDLFSFLMPCPEDSPSILNSPEDRKKYKYCFTHMLICNTIYGSQPFGHRQEIHRRIANYLEDQLSPENRSTILPSITFHYSNTSDQGKMYEYFEKLGLECVDKYLFQEGIAALQRLIHIHENEKKNEQNPLMSPIRQASWYSALAFAESGRKSMQSARKHVLKAMSLIQASWPETDQQYNLLLKQNTRKQNLLWLKTVGGRFSTGEPNPEKDKIMFRCLSVLHTLASLDPSLPPQDVSLVNLNYLNLSIAYGQRYRPEFVDGCLKSAEWHWLNKSKYLSTVYLNQGKKMSTKISDFEVFLNSPGALSIYKGDFSAGLNDLKLCADASKKRNDMATYHLTQLFVATTLTSTGKLEESYKMTKENCAEVDNNDEHIMTLMYSVAFEVNSVFLDKLDEATKFTSMIIQKSDYVTAALTKVFLGSCSILYLRKGEHGKALDRFQDMINAGMALMNVGQKMSMQLFGQCAIFPFLYFTAVTDHDPAKIQELVRTLNTAVNVAKKLWQLPCAEGAAAYRMYLAGSLLLQGKTALALNVIAKSCAGLKNMALIHGLHLAVLARFTTNEAEKARYMENATTVLTLIKANGLAEWAKGGEYGLNK
ncbi:hypothetical protein HDU98_008434 [Podochytrium sp. JEL0797]|nr:hypothetical protein HDU98_008434 [Podochytrium sp. JEL0797]